MLRFIIAFIIGISYSNLYAQHSIYPDSVFHKFLKKEISDSNQFKSLIDYLNYSVHDILPLTFQLVPLEYEKIKNSILDKSMLFGLPCCPACVPGDSLMDKTFNIINELPIVAPLPVPPIPPGPCCCENLLNAADSLSLTGFPKNTLFLDPFIFTYGFTKFSGYRAFINRKKGISYQYIYRVSKK